MNSTIHFSGKFSVIFLLLLITPCYFAAAQDDISDEELDRLLSDDDALEAWLEEEFSGWDFSAYSRLGWGYSDNVLLATVNPQSGNYFRTDVELFLIRYPDDNSDFFSFLTGTDLRYSGVEDVDKEVLWLFDTEWKRYLADQLNGTIKAQYVYFDQILDFSLTERQETRQRIQYHGYGLGTEVEFAAGGSNTFSLDAMLTREEFAQVLGQDWFGRVDLEWERPVWKGAELITELRAERRDYDDRVQRDRFGRPVPEELLVVDRGSASLELKQEWGKARAVDTSLKIKFLQNRDNGSGYFDYDQWGIDFSLDGVWKGLETNIAVGVDDTTFLIQPVERFSLNLRTKTDYWAEFFVRKKIMNRISVYLLVEYEESQSNVVEDEYNALSGSLGFQIDIWGEP